MADGGYIHGIIVNQSTGESQAVQSPATNIVGIVGTAPASKTLLNNTPEAFLGKKAALAAIYPEGSSGPKGSLYHAVVGVQEQTTARIVLIKAASESDADIITAIDGFLNAKSLTGYKPKILIASGFGNVNTMSLVEPFVGRSIKTLEVKVPEAISNPIAVKLATVARRLKAVAIIDGPNDQKELETFRKLNGNRRLYIVSPTVKVFDGTLIDVPASAYAAGVVARIKVGQSPSNQVINGILGTSVPISFEVDDPESKAQQYNGMEVATIVREDGGFLLWGTRGSGDRDDSKSNQIQKVRVSDSIEEALVSSTRWAVAAGISRDFIGAVERKVNIFLRSLIVDEQAIVGGKCEADKERNTADALARGDVYWKYDFTPVSVAETLHFEGFNTNKYYEGFV